MKKTDPIREHITNLLTKAEAHIDLRAALKDFPRELRGRKPQGGPHTPWQLLEHIRIAQSDILEFSRSAKHKSPKWPDEYWPKTEAPPSDKAWDKSVKQVLADLEAMDKLISDPKSDSCLQGALGRTLRMNLNQPNGVRVSPAAEGCGKQFRGVPLAALTESRSINPLSFFLTIYPFRLSDRRHDATVQK